MTFKYSCLVVVQPGNARDLLFFRLPANNVKVAFSESLVAIFGF